jgi:hypothetical protein
MTSNVYASWIYSLPSIGRIYQRKRNKIMILTCNDSMPWKCRIVQDFWTLGSLPRWNVSNHGERMRRICFEANELSSPHDDIRKSITLIQRFAN